jgi:hypothetical protein
MENEREKGLREELKRIQDSKPKDDSLLKLIKGLQRLQASGPPASTARSASVEKSEVARLVAKYQRSTTSDFRLAAWSTVSQALTVVDSSTRVEVYAQEGLRRCSDCCQVVPNAGLVEHWRVAGHTGSEPVYILRPVGKH